MARQKATDVVWHKHRVSKNERAGAKGQRPAIIWFTGLSGSGKSTLANALEVRLQAEGYHTYLLDGDNVRHGLNGDLGFSDEDRTENIRRIGEVAKLFVDAGIIVMAAFISPFRADRDAVRALVGQGEFVEVFVDVPLEEAEARDPKGMYRRARDGEIKDFTGIDSPYEVPEAPEVRLASDVMGVESCVEVLVKTLMKRGTLI